VPNKTARDFLPWRETCPRTDRAMAKNAAANPC
jgi:hypothetical protein